MQLFKEAGIRVQSPEMYERETLSGTEIRRRMLRNEPWKNLVPPEIIQVLDEIDGVGRLRQISRGDQ
jgi:nicotinamide-nucleotide adenylyltransferase